MATELIRIGKIVNTQGNRGALRILPLTDYPQRFNKMTTVKIEINGQISELNTEEVFFHKKFVIIKFKEIPDMNAALSLKGGFLVVDREELTPLPKGSYYIFDLIGIVVVDLCGERLGILTDVIQTGSNDVYVVETDNKPLLLPALKQVILNIDIEGKRMVVQVPEGL
ncbi:MAG: ribosome maturation factor RimM [Peptococcaceae bacterium]|nr:ribosome maturation factor RimM [Peptococcaceae bacterium]